jgi:hypothetical protein
MSIAAGALGAFACTKPTFVEDAGMDHHAASDDQPGEGDGEMMDEERDATSDPARANDAESAVMSGDASAAVASDGSTSVVQDASAPASDAGTNVSTDGSDAATGGALPDWARPLIGSYAKRSVTFSYEETVPVFNTRNVEDSILTIAQNGDALEASIKLCSYEVQAMGLMPVYFKNTAGMQPRKGHILLGTANTFTSEPMPQQLGFDRARADCNGSAHRMKYPDQTWIKGLQCDCSAARLPDSLTDCRVTDGDGDGNAGITLRAQFSPVAVLSDAVIAFESSVTFVAGQVMANKDHTVSELRSQGQSCLDPDNDSCNLGNNQLCAGGTTKLIAQEQVSCSNFPAAAFGALPDYPSKVEVCH